MRLLVQDETRLGLHEGHIRRRITACGVKPVQLMLPRYEYVWYYGAVDPITGESLFLELSALDADCFQIFVDEVSTTFPDTLNVMLLDGAPAHVAKRLRIPDNVLLVRLPPYCPELNPAERVWEDVRQRRSGDPPVTLSALTQEVGDILRAYSPETLASLTGYGYLRQAYFAQAA